MKKVKNSLNYNCEETVNTVFTLPSETIPDQTMSMREMLTRYAKGLPVGGVKEAIWDEHEENWGINPKTLDLVDIQAMKEENGELIKKLERQVKEQTKKAKEKEEQPEGH
jgi:hypothetical protein